MDAASTLTFLGVAIAIAISPGQTNLLVLSKGLSGQFQSVFAVLSGILLGNLAWILLCSVGVASLIHSSLIAFQVLKYIGAVYLVYLGIRTFIDASKNSGLPERAYSKRAFYQGMISSLSNPKGFVFYVAFLPQFVSGYGSVSSEIVFFGLLYLSIFIPVSLMYGIFGMRVTKLLKSNKIVARIKQTTGFILSSMGIALLTYKDA